MTSRLPSNATIPVAFLERLDAEFGPAIKERVLASFGAAKRSAFWVNPLLAGDVPDAADPIEGMSDAYAVAASARADLVDHPAARSGRIYVLNPSSLVAVHALAPRRGEEVLDLAAAPGGKTIVIAAMMQNVGRLAAVEPIRARFFRLRANLDRCGVEIARCYQDDGRRIGRKTPARFDRVLLDAPCASEARFRVDDPSSFAHWTPRKTKEVVRKQRGLIASAFQALKPGGTLVYCTCSLSVKENEGVVEWLLRREPSADVVPAVVPIETDAGRIDGTIRIWPDDLFDGFFVAKISKD